MISLNEKVPEVLVIYRHHTGAASIESHIIRLPTSLQVTSKVFFRLCRAFYGNATLRVIPFNVLVQFVVGQSYILKVQAPSYIESHHTAMAEIHGILEATFDCQFHMPQQIDLRSLKPAPVFLIIPQTRVWIYRTRLRNGNVMKRLLRKWEKVEGADLTLYELKLGRVTLEDNLEIGSELETKSLIKEQSLAKLIEVVWAIFFEGQLHPLYSRHLTSFRVVNCESSFLEARFSWMNHNVDFDDFSEIFWRYLEEKSRFPEPREDQSQESGGIKEELPMLASTPTRVSYSKDHMLTDAEFEEKFDWFKRQSELGWPDAPSFWKINLRFGETSREFNRRLSDATMDILTSYFNSDVGFHLIMDHEIFPFKRPDRSRALHHCLHVHQVDLNRIMKKMVQSINADLGDRSVIRVCVLLEPSSSELKFEIVYYQNHWTAKFKRNIDNFVREIR